MKRDWAIPEKELWIPNSLRQLFAFLLNIFAG